jgi:CubicO group peptidase (beta-lactamase class C family)
MPSSTTIAPDDRFATARAHIVDLVARGEIPSMAVAVAQRGKIVWEEAFGWADRENKVAATPNTIYKVGSLSKSITATGMMKLIQDGRVSLDDDVDRLFAPAVFTAYKGRASDIKVKHLLKMTAGIPHGSLGPYEWVRLRGGPGSPSRTSATRGPRLARQWGFPRAARAESPSTTPAGP